MTHSLVLAFSLVPLSFASAQGDLPVVAFDALTASQAPVYDHGSCAASNGDLTVLGGELRENQSTNSIEHRAFVRAVERTTGVERWMYVSDTSEQTLAVAVDATAQRVYAIVRKAVFDGAAGEEHLLVLDGATGNVLLDVASVLPVNQALSSSAVDALELSPAGDVLHRLDFHGSFTSGVALVRAYDTQSGALLWSDARTGLDPFEYRQSTQNGSLAVSPDGATVYTTFDRVDPANSGYRDTYVLSLAAAGGAQNWLRSLGTTNVIDRVSRPLVANDSSGVFVATEKLPPGAAYGPLLRLDAVDGSTVWSAPVDWLSFAVALSPNGAQIVVGGWTGNGALPNGNDPALHCFDSSTGAPLWSQSYPTAGFSEDPVDLVFAPNGAALHAYVVRNQIAPPFDDLMGLVTVRSNNGLLLWQDSFLIDTNALLDRHWLDAAATSPTTSIVALGQTITDLSIPVGHGSDQRRGYDAADGTLLWNETVTDTIDAHSDAALRVWLEPNEQHVLVWVKAAPSIDGTQTFRLERRDSATGALVSSMQAQDVGPSSSAYFKPNVSADGTHVAIERTGSGFGRRLAVYEIATGTLVFERDFGFNASEIMTAWDPSALRVHYITRGAASRMGVVDVPASQLVWEVIVPATGFLGGAVVPSGLAIHPTTGDQVATYDNIPYLQPSGTIFIVARNRDTGATSWSFQTSNTSITRHPRDHRDMSNIVNSGPSNELTTLTYSRDGTRVFATDTFLTGASTRARVASFDAVTGAFQWIASSPVGPGHYGRTLDRVESIDGRFVHVLAEGRGDFFTDPYRLHLTTVDAVTGALLWSTRVEGDNARARRVVSLGRGNRVAVLGTYDTDAAPSTGGFLAVFDSESGAELWRHELVDAARADLCDVAVATDDALVLVGSKTVGPQNVDALVRRIDRAVLEQGPDTMSLSGGGHVEMHVDFDVAHAGDIHVLVGTLSGTSPGLTLNGSFNLPLNYDAYTDVSLAYANSPLFVNSIGVLDAHGDGRSRVFVPPGSFGGFAGLPFSYAALAIDPVGGVSATSNPVFLAMLP